MANDSQVPSEGTPGVPGQDPVQGRVLRWVHEQGFPLELRVARAFRKAGWRVDHSQHFTDPIEEKAREFDVRATIRSEDRKQGLSVALAIECKNSRDKPWIVFMGDSDSDWGFAHEHIPDGLGQDILYTEYAPFDVPERHIFGHPPFAHGITTAFQKRGQDVAYEGCLAAASAAIAKARENENRISGPAFGIYMPELWIPLVVTRARIFGYGVTGENQDEISELQSAKVLLNHPTGDLIVVTIISEQHVPDFAAMTCESMHQLIDELVPNVTEAVDEWRGQPGH